MDIDFEFAKAKRLFVVTSPSIEIHLVGCGGTGSWLALSIVRIARLLVDRFHREVSLTFWDPDKVAEKNIYRQNFCWAEIGAPKAETLANRLGLAWGLDIIPRVAEFEDNGWRGYGGGLRILIGCVDKAAGRLSIAKCQQQWNDAPTTWWLDCGNGKSHGQVILGAGSKRPANPFVLAGYCNWLPWPADRWPGLLEDAPMSPKKDETKLSCAELALKSDQGLSINPRIAAEAGDYLVRLLLTGDLRKMETFIDLESGTTKSVYITEEALAHSEEEAQ